MNTRNVCSTLCLLAVSAVLFADESMTPSGFFIGLGGGYHSVALKQDLSGIGISNVYDSATNTLVAYGEAGGPATTFNETDSTFAPDIQFGYFGHFKNSEWLGGAKFSYRYLGLTITDDFIDLPQNGAFTPVGGSPDTFLGNVIIESVQTHINHELAFMAFIGRSFTTRSYAYLGAGPALFGTEVDLYHGTAYADINGVHEDISGGFLNFSDSQWMWGGVAQIGLTYFFNPTWFLDVNYSYAISAEYTIENSAPVTSYSEGYRTETNVFMETEQRVTSQGVVLTINKAF